MPAIFIGRFQPFHKGHLKAIKWILKREKKISIVIGSMQESLTKDNPLTFEERERMVKNVLFASGIKNFNIYAMPDVFDNALWARKILEITGLKTKKAVIFTQNLWTKKCFEKIEVKTKSHPIFFKGLSATQVREKIYNNKKWEDLVPKRVLNFLKKIEGIEKIKFYQVLPEERIVKFIKKEVKGGIVGVSGGIDSAVVAFLAKKALGKKANFVWLPFKKDCCFEKNILLLEKALKVKIKKIGFLEIYNKLLKILPKSNRIVKGNLKSRLRMAALYYFANLQNLLVVGTGNKSEREIGYFTKYGDGGVDIEPILDLYKTEVVEMAKRLKLPEEIINAVPTAGFWLEQTDEKEIGLSYQKLDTVLKLLSKDITEKEISFLTNIPQGKIKGIMERKRKNVHKLFFPLVCQIKSFRK